MIDLFFKSKKEPPVYPHTPLWKTENYGEQWHAEKAGLSIEEYRSRVKIVAMAYAQCKWKQGDSGYPYSEEAMEEHGQCRVVGVVAHYNQYGNVEWNNPPYILSVRPAKAPNTTVNCTAGWLQAHEPTKAC